MLSGCPALFSLVVISSLSLTQAAANNTTPPPAAAPGSASAVPECAANCMSIKITEAANWFGPGDVQTYCQHPEFLQAYDICLRDHCQGDDLIAGKEAGLKTCPPGAGGATPSNPKNSTGHPPISGPAGAPDNSTLNGFKGNTTNSTTPNSATTPGNNGSNLNGALTTANSLGNNATNATSRFSGAVSSAANNASSQAGAASTISSSSAVIVTALSSCLLSLVF